VSALAKPLRALAAITRPARFFPHERPERRYALHTQDRAPLEIFISIAW
jgi:hypothetical protein